MQQNYYTTLSNYSNSNTVYFTCNNPAIKPKFSENIRLVRSYEYALNKIDDLLYNEPEYSNKRNILREKARSIFYVAIFNGDLIINGSEMDKVNTINDFLYLAQTINETIISYTGTQNNYNPGPIYIEPEKE